MDCVKKIQNQCTMRNVELRIYKNLFLMNCVKKFQTDLIGLSLRKTPPTRPMYTPVNDRLLSR